MSLSKVIVHFTKYFRLLVGPGGTREAMFFCRSATRTFLRICWVVIYRNVALSLKPSIMARAVIRGMSATQLTRISICPRQTLAWKILAGVKVMPIQVWRENTSNFAFVLFCYITNHFMTGPLGNSEYCFPRISMFHTTSSRETLRFSGNKIHCSPRDQSLSVNCCSV